MLYTGGTTGMPKGVMYDIGGITPGFIDPGFPAVGLPMPPHRRGEIAALVQRPPRRRAGARGSSPRAR